MTSGTTAQAEQTGLFLACYQIGGNQPGAPLFAVQLSVYTPGEKLSGFGRITQATNPPLDLATKLEGDYMYMTVMPNESHILVVATGYPPLDWPPHGGLGPVIPPNVQLRMVLTADWKGGTANYQYRAGDGSWRSVANAPVRSVACTTVG
jgi:hypothetical protein